MLLVTSALVLYDARDELASVYESDFLVNIIEFTLHTPWILIKIGHWPSINVQRLYYCDYFRVKDEETDFDFAFNTNNANQIRLFQEHTL